MRLRSRFATELKARLSAALPEAMATVWDVQAVVVAVEQIKFTVAGGDENGWDRRSEFAGIVRAEIRADTIDELVVEPLIADLVSDVVHLNYNPFAEVGEISERVRFVLLDWRDVIRDTQVASALRFSVEGTLAARAAETARPELLVSEAPQIGVGHEGDYRQAEAL